MSDLHKDKDGREVQGAMTPLVARKISVTDTTARQALTYSCRIVRLVATKNCFVNFGDGTVEAANTDHYMAEGATEYFHLLIWQTYIAAIRSTENGTLYISEMG